ncbi:MAG: hypothetical protein QOE41_892 [Mycobacterium sp.]|jgi:hypothetical protein|nr:hypothetical protein [Mycobacterium sp.]MDT5131581.1 hypothetical protein [Mycobacterium sp.]
MVNRRNKMIAAVLTGLAGTAICAGAAVASAQPAPAPPPPPSVVDQPEPGDTPDAVGAADTDNVQEGDQNAPDTPAPPAGR